MENEKGETVMKKKIFRILCLLLCAVFVFSVMAAADFGNAEGGGDWDFGDSDWGDSDWGDSDWGDSDFGGVLFLLSDGNPVVILIVVAVLIVFFILRNRKNGGSSVMPTQKVMPRDYAAIETAVLAKIHAVDPAFAVEDFKTFAGDVLVRAQKSWEEKNLRAFRPYISDTYFNTVHAQLEEFIRQKKTNHLDGTCVVDTYLTGFETNDRYEVLTVRIKATLFDYVTDDATGNLLSGSQSDRQTRYYRLTFIRTAGKKTAVGEKLSSATCPNCGAPLQLTAAGVCEYCMSVITTSEFDWVLNRYELWRD